MENTRKLELLEQIRHWCGIMNRRVSGTAKEIKQIYDIYNEYFNPVKPETNTGCSTCMSKVYNAFRLVNNDYEKIKAELTPKEKVETTKPKGWQLRKSYIDESGQEWCYGKKVE